MIHNEKMISINIVYICQLLNKGHNYNTTIYVNHGKNIASQVQSKKYWVNITRVDSCNSAACEVSITK